MNDICKGWLKELLDEAIDEAKIAIENERIWAAGSTDANAEECHNENVALEEEYIELLVEIKEQYVGE